MSDNTSVCDTTPVNGHCHGQTGYAAFVIDRVQRGYFKRAAMNRTCRVLKSLDATERRTFTQFKSMPAPPRIGRLETFIAPLGLSNLFVLEKHRHNLPVTGHIFSIGVRDAVAVRGYAIVGRPVSRILDDGQTLEVTRVVTDGTRNACSKLYGAIRRHIRHLNRSDGKQYRTIITYTLLESESGTSLKASGFYPEHITKGRSWDTPSRRRSGTPPAGDKIRWRCPV